MDTGADHMTLKLLIIGTFAGIVFFDVGTLGFKLWEFGIVLGSLALASPRGSVE
jgi:hypothetical protein